MVIRSGARQLEAGRGLFSRLLLVLVQLLMLLVVVVVHGGGDGGRRAWQFVVVVFLLQQLLLLWLLLLLQSFAANSASCVQTSPALKTDHAKYIALTLDHRRLRSR